MSLHSLTTPSDISILISSVNASSEKRVTPTWTLAHLKSKLEPVTGIPPSSQRLILKAPGGSQEGTILTTENEDHKSLDAYGVGKGCEIIVEDVRPPSLRPNYNDPSGVEKYVLPESRYENLSDSVLAWKRTQKLGRFDPDAPTRHAEAVEAHEREARERSVENGKRVRVGGEDTRRGTIRYVGPIPELPGPGGWWVGVDLDEPVGKNDGSVGDTRYFQTNSATSEGGGKSGIFVRPERVEVGDWEVLNELVDLEEI
ncbi:MAG: hypothetical protein M4579_004765 [Chaenotheca gracillima]|nr:MAG: hypothetical protein M4579_004765 [Chaenotheca gracillima]